MILKNRAGNKTKLVPKIEQFFPEDITTYIELFFGGGGMFFNLKNRTFKNSILNDIDSQVFNLWQSLLVPELQQLFLELVELTPVHAEILKYLRKNEFEYNKFSPVLEGFKLWYSQAYSMYGGGATIATDRQRINLETLQQTIQLVAAKLKNAVLLNLSYEKVLNAVSKDLLKNVFIYADPPYCNTSAKYRQNFGPADLEQLIKFLLNTRYRFAISEYQNETTMELFTKYNLNIHHVATRHSIKAYRTEILATNYN